MADKASRLAARRQAILGSRGERLARLSSSARGDDPGGVYAQDIQAAATTNLKTFVGEETTLPPPPAVTVTPSKSTEGAETPNSSNSKFTESPRQRPSAARERTPEWTPQQQEELMKSLFAADASYSTQPHPPKISASPSTQQTKPDNTDDILAQLFSSLDGSAEKYLQHVETAPPPPRTLGQRLIPILHLFSMIGLVVWFAMFREPEQFRLSVASVGVRGVEVEDSFGWKRWASLASRKPVADVWSVPTLSSFFWAFTTIELLLHSLRLVSKPTPYRPPLLIGLALPHLPGPIPKIILTSLQYLQMGTMVLNDLAVLIFGLGMVIYVSSWKTG